MQITKAQRVSRSKGRLKRAAGTPQSIRGGRTREDKSCGAAISLGAAVHSLIEFAKDVASRG